jgi:hypothetical protein
VCDDPNLPVLKELAVTNGKDAGSRKTDKDLFVSGGSVHDLKDVPILEF